jgi:hypothetical protein
MKINIFSAGIIVVVAAIVLSSSFKKNPATKTSGMFEPVAVIELFTSQGCSSCPPADALLAQTIANEKKDGEKIFALSFHVDYWNRLGWKDPFSESKYSQRQKDYVSAMGLDGAYTPQMIVNGSSQFVGSDNNSLTRSVAIALQTKAAVNFKTLKVTYIQGKPIKVQYVLEGDFATGKINFALVSLSETTVVKRGENGGHTLQNENVVRQLISKKANTAGEIEFANAPQQAKENTAIIAFVQEEKTLKIIGAAIAKN